MFPLEGDSQQGFTLLLSGAIAVLVPGLITLIVKLIEYRQKRKEAKDGKSKTDAEAGKTKADTNSVEADVFTKALQGQGTVVQQLLAENQRAYDRAKEAEDKADIANQTADAAKADANTAREEVAKLRKDMENFQQQQRAFEIQIEGYLTKHKTPLPEWWPHRHDPDGGTDQV